MRRIATVLCVVLVSAVPSWAQSTSRGKGQGAIVITDGAILYEDSEGDDAYPEDFGGSVAVVPKGAAVAGLTTLLRQAQGYEFEESNGRVHVLALDQAKGRRNGIVVSGWMNRADLSPYFTYECGCGLREAPCSPHAKASFVRFKWNVCFDEAKQAKLAQMQAAPTTPTLAPPSSESPEKRLQSLNELYKKGLISKEEYDKKKAEILDSM